MSGRHVPKVLVKDEYAKRVHEAARKSWEFCLKNGPHTEVKRNKNAEYKFIWR